MFREKETNTQFARETTTIKYTYKSPFYSCCEAELLGPFAGKVCPCLKKWKKIEDEGKTFHFALSHKTRSPPCTDASWCITDQKPK